jgi:predicted transcriptional regulator
MGEEPADSGPGARRASGELEAAVWAVLTGAGTPLSTGEVRERLGADGEDLAYTTVVTTLGRLYRKGLLTRSLSGRAHRYAPATTTSGLAARRMHQALADEADHGAVLSHFLSDLSGRDEALLRQLLADELGPAAGPATDGDAEAGAGPHAGTGEG